MDMSVGRNGPREPPEADRQSWRGYGKAIEFILGFGGCTISSAIGENALVMESCEDAEEKADADGYKGQRSLLFGEFERAVD